MTAPKQQAAGTVSATAMQSGTSTSSGAVAIDPKVIDTLQEVEFPRKGLKLQPKDAGDELLMMCARAIACCDNRALTPKEIAAIASRKWGWTCNGSQPFAVISSSIRSHLRRAGLAVPPYPTIFSSYELASVPPAEDIPCLGIEKESRPVVKRGTFWFLSEAMGFPNPFPHRAGDASLGSNVTIAGSSSNSAPHSASKLVGSGGISNQVGQPGTPSQSSGITLSLSKTQLGTPSNGEEKPMTRAQQKAAAHGTPVLPSPVPHPIAMQPLPPLQQQLSTSLPNDPLGRGKRKRLGSQGINPLLAVPTLPSIVSSSSPFGTPSGLPHLQARPAILPAHSTPDSNHAPLSGATTVPGAHRRAFSSSASDATKPSSGLRKLKLRLSAVSETTTPNSSPSAGLKKVSSASSLTRLAPSTSSTKKLTTEGQPPLSKRQRTQSMSQLSSSNAAANFPFDNLLSTSSLQSFITQHHQNLQSQQRIQQRSVPAPLGTVYPQDIHNIPACPAGSNFLTNQIDLLTSRSAPEENFIFSPPVPTPTVISGPFSRSHSPVSHFNKIRSQPPEASFVSDAEESIAGTPGEMSMELSTEYDPVKRGAFLGAGSRSLSNSAILAAQRALGGSIDGSAIAEEEEGEGTALDGNSRRDYHEAMLKTDLDFDFDFSLQNLRESTEEAMSLMEQDDVRVSAVRSEEGVRRYSPHMEQEDSFEMDMSLDEGRLSVPRGDSTEIDGTFDGLPTADVGPSSVGLTSQHESLSKTPKVEHDENSPAGVVAGEEQVEDEIDDEDEGDVKALIEGHALQRALNTTLCPAAAKFGDNVRPSQLLARRMNSSSSFVFPRLSSKATIETETLLATSKLTRPKPIGRTISKDNLTTPVPLVELPSIPLHTASDLYAQLSHVDIGEEEGEYSITDRTARRDSSTPLTPIIKAEEDLEESNFSIDMHPADARLRRSRSARSQSEDSASDPFRPEAYVRGGSDALEQSLSRSRSSSRRTSLSPRDSFSPQASDRCGPSADWALTPPSEEEQMIDEEEKNLDRATLLGPESVGMDEFDDVWPYYRGQHHNASRAHRAGASRTAAQQASHASHPHPHQQIPSNDSAGVDDATEGVKALEMDVFEPVISPAPLPKLDVPPVFVRHPSPFLLGSTESQMKETALDEQTAAAMFLAEDHLLSSPVVDFAPEPSTLPTCAASIETNAVSVVADSDHSVLPSGSGPASTPFMIAAATPFPHTAPSAPEPSLLFYAHTPFDPPISILLTDTKVLFYSTMVDISYATQNTLMKPTRPLLRRIDNDAVDAEALLMSFACGDPELDRDSQGTLKRMKEAQENTWIPLSDARELLAKYGKHSPLGVFLGDDILFSFSKDLIKIGRSLRNRNGLSTPASPTATPLPAVASASTPSPVLLPRTKPAPIAPAPISNKTSGAAVSSKTSSSIGRKASSSPKPIPIKAKKSSPAVASPKPDKPISTKAGKEKVPNIVPVVVSTSSGRSVTPVVSATPTVEAVKEARPEAVQTPKSNAVAVKAGKTSGSTRRSARNKTA